MTAGFSSGSTSPREYLFSLEQIGIKLGLEQIQRLLRALDRPDLAFPSIIVAGTNGKGSVTAMIERGLRDAGYVTGRYTSPHLVHIEERFAINGQPISAETFDHLAARIQTAAESLDVPPSFFEATTALALEAFRGAGVTAAVLEVGLGGRLDATNAVTPICAVITSIDMDHQQYLGNTIEAIAGEKAGIIKPNVSTVLGSNTETVRTVIETFARERESRLVYAPEDVSVEAEMVAGQNVVTIATPAGVTGPVTLGLRGRHQVDNAVTALCAMEVIDSEDLLRIPHASRVRGLADVEWPARLEMRNWNGAQVLIDGAHNPAGAQALAHYLREAFNRPLPIVFAAMQDKDVAGIIAALAPAASAFICTAAQSPRAARPAHLAAAVSVIAGDVPVQMADTPALALETAASFGQPIVAAGSLYLAGEIRELLS